MRQANLDRFLAEQMKEPGFAAVFRKAAPEWDRKLRRAPPAGLLQGNHKPEPAHEIAEEPVGRDHHAERQLKSIVTINEVLLLSSVRW
jgi:hypothetical protein